MKRVVIHSDAQAELKDAIDHYERQKPGLGLALQNAVEHAIGRIQQNPEMGAKHKSSAHRYRLVRRFPYVIFYLELTDAIWVSAIAHGKRLPGYWKGRRPE